MGEQVRVFFVAAVATDVKQRRMQMVTVRGVSFRVDSRGTKLQRVQSSVSHPGTAKFVCSYQHFQLPHKHKNEDLSHLQ